VPMGPHGHPATASGGGVACISLMRPDAPGSTAFLKASCERLCPKTRSGCTKCSGFARNAVDRRLAHATCRVPHVAWCMPRPAPRVAHRSEEHTSELQSRFDLVCRLLLEKK